MSEPTGERMNYTLLKALRRGDETVVRTFFSQDTESSEVTDHAVDVERRSWRGVTAGGNSALHIVAGFGHLDLAKFICDRDNSLLAARNAAKETPLHSAARAGAGRIVKHFISVATDSGRLKELLLAKDRKGKTALYVAAEEGRAAVATELMSKLPELATEDDMEGVSPLYVAVLSESLEVVQILINSSVDVSYGGPNGQTALHAATMIENPEIANKLLQWKSTLVKKADNSRGTPLHYLATTFKGYMVHRLLKHDISPAYASNSNGLCPVHVASSLGRSEIVCELINCCPDMDELVDNKGRNFLHVAVAEEREAIVRFVCDSSLLVKMMNAKDYDGNTPLHLAMASQNQQIMSLLLENKSVHPRIINKDGRTPLDLAITRLDKSVHTKTMNKDVQTPLDNESVRPSNINKDDQTPLDDEIIRLKYGSILQHGVPKRLSRSAAPITIEEGEEEEEPQTVFEWEQERMNDELIKALKRGDARTVERLFSPATEASVAADHQLTIHLPDADNVADQAGSRSCARDSSFLAACNAALETLLHCAVRTGTVLRKVFSHTTEASVAPDHTLAIDLSDADNVADQAARRSCQGVTVGGNSALHIVATFGHLELAKLICARDSSLLEARNAALETPLHCAARAKTPLHCIARAKADRIVSLFISEVCQWEEGRRLELLRATDREGKTALHAAAEKGHSAVVRVLVSADPGLVAFVDDNGVSPLYAAVQMKSLEVVQILIGSPAKGGKQTGTTSAGATPKASYAGPKGQTALHAAAIVKSPEIAGKLMQWKEKLANQVDNSRRTPLHYAAGTSNTSLVCQLLDHDASLAYLSDSEGFYPIHIAAKWGRCAIIRKLMDRCHDLDELVDKKGMNFLHIAVKKRNLMVVKYVCQRRELARMMNARDENGNTPLHLAVSSQNQEIVRLLLENRCVQLNLKNRNGQTPRDCAIGQIEHGLHATQNPQSWIARCLRHIGAIRSLPRLDCFRCENITKPNPEKELKKYESITQNLVIVSVLIGTVTFAAVFTMPGGYIDDDHQNGGTPTLARKYFFTAFIISDCIAFFCSIMASLWLMYAGSAVLHPSRRLKFILRSQNFITTAAQSLMAAFALSVYVVLAPVNVLIALAVCIFAFPTVLLSNSDFCQRFRRIVTVLKRRVGWSPGMCKVRWRPCELPTKGFKWYFFRTIMYYLLVYIVIFAASLILSIRHLHFT